MVDLKSPRAQLWLVRVLVCGIIAVTMTGTIYFLVSAIRATEFGYDPVLGPHPVKATATVTKYTVDKCNRFCNYKEQVTFDSPDGVGLVAHINVSTEPSVGDIETVWYPNGDPSNAQLHGPRNGVYYWLSAAAFAFATALIVTIAFLLTRWWASRTATARAVRP